MSHMTYNPFYFKSSVPVEIQCNDDTLSEISLQMFKNSEQNNQYLQ